MDAVWTKRVTVLCRAVNYMTGGGHIAVEGQGNSYYLFGFSLGLGSAPAPPSTFPTTPGAFQPSPPDFEASGNLGLGFVTKLNVAGSALIYSTYLYASADVGLSGFAGGPPGGPPVQVSAPPVRFSTPP